MIKKSIIATLLLLFAIDAIAVSAQCPSPENPYVRRHLNLGKLKCSSVQNQNASVRKSFNLFRSKRSSGPQNPYIHKSLNLPRFNAVEVIGDIDVNVEGGAVRQQIDVAGRRKGVESTVIYTKGKTLYISPLAQPRGAQRVKISLAMPILNQFSYAKGAANISIKQSSPYYPILGINIQGSPKVNINGNLKLRKLIVGGSTRVSVTWVNSCDFYLRAMENASVFVSGIATTFEADVMHCARVNAKYLRTNRVFIKTYGNSRADIRASCALNALASQCSSIYFYQNPRFQAPYMSCAGSVVQMTNIYYPPCDICDNACCKNGWH